MKFVALKVFLEVVCVGFFVITVSCYFGSVWAELTSVKRVIMEAARS